MLQIASGMYFRDVPLHETLHRDVFFSNAAALRSAAVELAFGRLLFASGTSTITPITIEVMDRLEAVDASGESSVMVATGGRELLDDAASVVAFALNVTCSRQLSQVDRIVPQALPTGPTRGPASILRRTFDPGVMLLSSDFDGLRAFVSRLLALNRGHFEAAMRSIRKINAATFLVSEDPGLAYTLFVAALESLVNDGTSQADAYADWDTYDPKKRQILDDRLSSLEPEQIAIVRSAILEADQLSLTRRFVDFVSDHIRPSYFRADASGAKQAMGSTDVEHALRTAYRLRSRTIHELRELEPELWVISDRADTLRWEGRRVLALEGLNRLCRHVVRTYIDRSPTVHDDVFDYRQNLPGIVRMELAPQYWVGKVGDNFSATMAPRQLQGFIDVLIPVLSGEEDQIPVDLTNLLTHIERLLPSEARVEKRRPMIAIYILWNSILATEFRRPGYEHVIRDFEAVLCKPSIEAFIVGLLLGVQLDWSAQELDNLATDRLAELGRGRGQPLTRRLDAGLLLFAAQKRLDDSEIERGQQLISTAVEFCPGLKELVDLEEQVRTGKHVDIDVQEFAFGRDGWSESDVSQLQRND